MRKVQTQLYKTFLQCWSGPGPSGTFQHTIMSIQNCFKCALSKLFQVSQLAPCTFLRNVLAAWRYVTTGRHADLPVFSVWPFLESQILWRVAIAAALALYFSVLASDGGSISKHLSTLGARKYNNCSSQGVCGRTYGVYGFCVFPRE